MKEALMPLSMVGPGQKVILVDVQGGWGIRRRLANMGLNPGVKFEVISTTFPGPTIIKVRDTRLMLGSGMVQKIMVRPV